MGMLLFDKSGTFVPSTYGLTVGDVLHIVAIGGGGSSGAAGGATSFSSLLTVAGGAAAGSSGYGGEGGWHPALPVTLCSAPPDVVPVGTSMYSNAGGGYCIQKLLSGSSSELSTTTVCYPFATLFGGAGDSTRVSGAKASSSARGTSGNYNGGGGASATAKSYNDTAKAYADTVAGGGGAGYGAGGGGGYAAAWGSDTAYKRNGGAHGVFKWLDYVIAASSPSSFAITIGAGGAAGTVEGTDTNCSYSYGAGASGCVAIYW